MPTTWRWSRWRRRLLTFLWKISVIFPAPRQFEIIFTRCGSVLVLIRLVRWWFLTSGRVKCLFLALMKPQKPPKLMYRRPQSRDKYENITDVLDDILIRLENLETQLKNNELHQSWTKWDRPSDPWSEERPRQRAYYDDCRAFGRSWEQSCWNREES